jgi:hypothetical protein
MIGGSVCILTVALVAIAGADWRAGPRAGGASPRAPLSFSMLELQSETPGISPFGRKTQAAGAAYDYIETELAIKGVGPLTVAHNCTETGKHCCAADAPLGCCCSMFKQRVPRKNATLATGIPIEPHFCTSVGPQCCAKGMPFDCCCGKFAAIAASAQHAPAALHNDALEKSVPHNCTETGRHCCTAEADFSCCCSMFKEDTKKRIKRSVTGNMAKMALAMEVRRQQKAMQEDEQRLRIGATASREKTRKGRPTGSDSAVLLRKELNADANETPPAEGKAGKILEEAESEIRNDAMLQHSGESYVSEEHANGHDGDSGARSWKPPSFSFAHLLSPRGVQQLAGGNPL